MFALRYFEYSIAPVKCEMDRGEHDTLIFGSDTATETKITELIQNRYGNDTGKEVGISEQIVFFLG